MFRFDPDGQAISVGQLLVPARRPAEIFTRNVIILEPFWLSMALDSVLRRRTGRKMESSAFADHAEACLCYFATKFRVASLYKKMSRNPQNRAFTSIPTITKDVFV